MSTSTRLIRSTKLDKIPEEPSTPRARANKSKKTDKNSQQQHIDQQLTHNNTESTSKKVPPKAPKASNINKIKDIKAILNGNPTTKRNKYQQSLQRETNRSSKSARPNNNINNKNQHKTIQATTKYRTRATLKLTIPASDNPLSRAINLMKEFLTQLQDSDDSICIIPWHDEDAKKTDIIETIGDVPTKLNELTIFHPRFYPGRPQQDNTLYVKVHFGHEEKFESISMDIKYWLMSGNHGFYHNMLQAESTETIGWLLYSTRSIDAGALAEDLYDKFEVQVGLRWMTIDTGTKGKIPFDKKVFALHVEAIKQEKNTVKKALLQLYSRSSWITSQDLPNGIRLRFVTPRRDATSTHAITKLDRLRQRQKGFLNTVERSETNWDILHLDWRLRDETPTLREMIMSLKSNTHDTKLFLSVDLDQQKSGFVFLYLPEVREEARSMIRTLYTYLLWELNVRREEDYDPEDSYDIEPLREEELQKFFDADALLRMEDLIYDPVKKVVVDKYVDTYLEFIDDKELLGNKFDQEDETEIEILNRPTPKPLESNVFREGDDDTVSTLGTVKTSLSSKSRTRIKKSTRTNYNYDDSNTIGSESTVSAESFSTLESQVNTMNTEFQLHTSKLDQLIKLIAENNTSNTKKISQSNSGTFDAGGVTSSAGNRR
jgi:hypothetical protein